MRTMKHRGLFVAALLVCAALVSAQGGGGGQGRGQGGGRGFGGGFGQFGRGGGSEMNLAMRKDVQADLGVTEDQKKKLEELQTKQREAMRGQGGGGRGQGGNGGGQGAGGFDREAMMKRMEEMRAQQKKDLAAILSADQMKRLDEISIQLRGSSALTDAAVQKSLGLSTEQTTKIKTLQDQQQEANMALFEKVRNQEVTREEMQATMEKNTKKMDELLLGVLTEDQKTKFKALGGKPFKADPNENQRGGGRRGGGGGGN